MRTLFQRILEFVCRPLPHVPSAYVPQPGEHFRARQLNAKPDCRSYMGDVYRCLAVQDGAIAAALVFNTYQVGAYKEKRIMLVGDVEFFPCDKLIKALTADRSEFT